MDETLARFYQEKAERIAGNGRNRKLQEAARGFMGEAIKAQYSYNFSWLGRPVIQHPEDLVAMQEIIWQVRPRLIVETGVAHGGSAIFHASLLELLGGDGLVLAIDIEIRPHNRPLIENHPLAGRLRLMETSSLDEAAVAEARALAARGGPVLVVLDSNHSHAHVLAEMRLYSELVTPGSYMVVFDGVVEKFPELHTHRPWGPGDNPLTAIRAFLAENTAFEVDWEIENKLLISTATEGYLKRRA